MALYGYHPLSVTSPLKGTGMVQLVEDHIGHRQEVLKILKDNLVMAQNRMKQQAKQHRSGRNLKWGIGYF